MNSVAASPAARAGSILDRLGIWPARVTWLALPLLIGPGIGALLEGYSQSVSLTVEVMAWAAWFGGLVCVLAPSTVSLTVFRTLCPVPLVGLACGIVAQNQSDSGLTVAVAVAAAALALGVAMLAITGDVMVNGSAYGPERRLALRPPASLLLGPIALTWVAMFAATVGGPLLMASGRWLLGVPLTAVAGLLLYRGGTSLHQLSRRWIVFTPAGFVIHDYFVLAESILLQRKAIVALGPAPAEPRGTLDLSAGALGLALQVEATEAVEAAIRSGRDVTVTDTIRMIFSPSLPGVLLREARIRGISVALADTTPRPH